jgi:hypothetical protein
VTDLLIGHLGSQEADPRPETTSADSHIRRINPHL